MSIAYIIEHIDNLYIKVKKITDVIGNCAGDPRYPFASVTLIDYKVLESSFNNN